MSKKTREISEKELTKAGSNLMTADQLDAIFSRTPSRHLYKRKGRGGKEFTYVKGSYIKKVLNYLFGWDWDFVILWEKQTDNDIVVKGQLVCRSRDKTIVKTQYGGAKIKFMKTKDGIMPVDLGDDYKAAATDSLKKCASELGIASDVYSDEEFVELNVMSEQQVNDEIAELQEKLLAAFDDYPGNDKLDLQRIVGAKIQAGEFTVEFGEQMLTQITGNEN